MLRRILDCIGFFCFLRRIILRAVITDLLRSKALRAVILCLFRRISTRPFHAGALLAGSERFLPLPGFFRSRSFRFFLTHIQAGCTVKLPEGTLLVPVGKPLHRLQAAQAHLHLRGQFDILQINKKHRFFQLPDKIQFIPAVITLKIIL